MKNKSDSIQFFIILLIVSASNLFSADIKVGVSANYNLTNYNSIHIPGVTCNCNPFNESAGNGYSAGLMFELNTNLLFVDSWVLRGGIQSNPLKESKPSAYSFKGVNSNGQEIYTHARNELEIKNKTLFLDVMYKLSLFKTGFHLSLGPSLTYVYENNAKQKYLLEQGQYYQIYDTLISSIDIYDNSVPAMKKLRANLKGGLQYDLYISAFCFSFAAFYTYPLYDLKGYGWKVNYFQFGVDCLFVL